MQKRWIMDEIEQLAQFGQDKRGVTRLAFSSADCAARQYIVGLMEQNGLHVRIDEIGNVIGRLEGALANAPAVMTGSHLDTVPESGKFDGSVGVIGGIAALKELQNRGQLTYPLEVVVFTGAEANHFGMSAIGSRLMAGLTNAKTLKRLKDDQGVALAQMLAHQGLQLDQADKAVRRAQDIKAFIELHIEQGRLLEDSQTMVGIIEKIAAPAKCKIIVEGVAAHCGTTPIYERRDALVSAAMVVLAINGIAVDMASQGIVATVGVLSVLPGAVNVVPGHVEMLVDIRGHDHQSIVECLQEIKDAVSEIVKQQDTGIAIEVLSSERPAFMDGDIVELLDGICRRQGIACQQMNSGAGHNAMNMARITKAGLLVIPCRAGISHNPDEYASEDDIVQGVRILTEALYQLAK